MEIFIFKLIVAVTPLVILIGSVLFWMSVAEIRTQHRTTRPGTRRNILRALAAGILLR